MSPDDSLNVPAKRDRREAVREKALQVQTRQSRLRILRGVLLSVVGLALVGGAALAITWALTESGSRPQLQPPNVEDDGFVVTAVAGIAAPLSGSVDGAAPVAREQDAAVADEPTPTPTVTATAAPTVEIRVYVDYLSPGAREFQLANMSQLSQWVSNDTASLTYYPVSMLTAKSNGTRYSLRAASAAACVATHSPERFFHFNHQLLLAQPEIDTDGMSDEELADLAIGSSVDDPDTVRDCIENEEYAAWARAATDRALQGLPGIDNVSLTGTPMVLVNGTPYVGQLDDPNEFQQFVLAIESDAYWSTPTPTPTPSATETTSPTPAP